MSNIQNIGKSVPRKKCIALSAYSKDVSVMRILTRKINTWKDNNNNSY